MTEKYLSYVSTFTRELELSHLEKPLIIHQQLLSDVGGVVWDGALVLAAYISKLKIDESKNITVVELGCGTGAVGLVFGTLPATKVILTDLPELQPLAEMNIKQNEELLKAKCEFEVLNWNSAKEFSERVKPDFIIASECVYYEDSIEPLVDTMVALCSSKCRILVALELRQGEKNIAALRKFITLANENFVTQEIPFDELDEEFRSEDIKIMSLTIKKP